jgi:hypothetical protein
MMQFPLDTLLDEQAWYDFLLRVLHPNGLACPHGHQLPADQAPHEKAARAESGLPLPHVWRGQKSVHLHALLQDSLSLFHNCAHPTRDRARHPNQAPGGRSGQ